MSPKRDINWELSFLEDISKRQAKLLRKYRTRLRQLTIDFERFRARVEREKTTAYFKSFCGENKVSFVSFCTFRLPFLLSTPRFYTQTY
jgi:hypothetical protein